MKIRIAGMYVITDGVHPGQESLQGDEERAEGNEGRVQAFPGRPQRGSDPWASGKTVWGGEMGGSQAGGV